MYYSDFKFQRVESKTKKNLYKKKKKKKIVRKLLCKRMEKKKLRWALTRIFLITNLKFKQIKTKNQSQHFKFRI